MLVVLYLHRSIQCVTIVVRPPCSFKNWILYPQNDLRHCFILVLVQNKHLSRGFQTVCESIQMKIVENGTRCKFGEITFPKAKFQNSHAVCPCQQLYQCIVNGRCLRITLTYTDICVVQRGTAVYIVTITTLVT